MTIEPDVRAVARYFGLDPALVQAVVNAEGNIVKAVQCSFPSVEKREDALRILCRSAVHALSDFVKRTNPGPFIAFWRDRWAPLDATNDPTGLNAHWERNVSQLSGWGSTTV